MGFYPFVPVSTSTQAAWQFKPESYGAVHDKKTATDGAMNSSSSPTHLTCATSTPFTSGDLHKTVYVVGAGAAGADLYGTITQVLSASTVVLSVSASTTVSSAGVIWATDDTAAVQSTIAAAVAYAQANDGYGEVALGPYVYMCNSAPTIGGPTAGNSILTLPPITDTLNKVVLRFSGPSWAADAYSHWLQLNPQYSGAVLQTTRLDGTVDGTNGQAFVLGGPYAGYGAGPVLFSNMMVIIDSVTFAVPWNSTYGGAGFFGIAQVNVIAGACLAQGTLATTSWPKITGGGPTSGTSTGLMMPDVNNNDRCDIAFWGCEGIGTALVAPEHVTFQSIYAQFCGTALTPVSPSGTSAAHLSVTGNYISAESCFAGIGNYTGVSSKIWVDILDMEVFTYVVDDASNATLGYVGVLANDTPGYDSLPSNGGTALKIAYIQTPPGPVSSPASPPLTTVAWPNQYYRDAWITVSLSGGNHFTAFTINSVSQPNAVGVGTYGFVLPAGQSYTPSYAAGTLSHTVTLL